MSIRVEVEGFPAFDTSKGQTLLEACEAAGVPMECACGGFAACNSCRVLVLEGGDVLDPADMEEACFLDEPGQRLGCQVMLKAPMRCRLDPGC